jgi:hypothetical protein
MIKPIENVTYERAPNRVFQKLVSDTYYLREKPTGAIYSEVVNISINIDDYEEVLDMPLPIEIEE